MSPEDVQENYKEIKRNVAALVKSEMDKIEARKPKEDGQQITETSNKKEKEPHAAVVSEELSNRFIESEQSQKNVSKQNEQGDNNRALSY